MRVAGMKAWIACTLLACVPLASAADYRQHYAEQWPLSLSSAQSGAYRVVLEAPVYRRAAAPDLADVQVFNAAGQSLPSALLAPDAPLAQSPVQRELPWFVLPAADARTSGDLRLLTDLDSDGRVRRVEARIGTAGAAAAGGWLVDASVLGRQPVSALVLDWAQADAPLQTQVRVEVSDDLAHWQVVQASAPLMDLQRVGKRLLQRRLQIDASPQYLRISPLPGQVLPVLRSVIAELPPAPATLTWEWETLQPVSSGNGEFFFTLDGRFPITRAQVQTADNSAVQWALYSRDADEAPWQRRAGPWMAWQLDRDGEREQSAAQALNGGQRNRQWKLVASPADSGTVPTLRLGYRPEVLVFLSQGVAPYALAVGSATLRRSDAPVAPLIEELRLRNGPQWQPALARMESSAEMLAGNAALQAPRDWKRWLLWGLLLLGVLVVAGLALSVLRTGASGGRGGPEQP